MDLSIYRSTKLRVFDLKPVKGSINESNLSYQSCTLLSYAKKDKYFQESSMFTFTHTHTHTNTHTHIFIYIHRYIHIYIQTQIFRVYLIWRPKLNVSKVGMLLSKNTPNGPKIPHLLFFFFFFEWNFSISFCQIPNLWFYLNKNKPRKDC